MKKNLKLLTTSLIVALSFASPQSSHSTELEEGKQPMNSVRPVSSASLAAGFDLDRDEIFDLSTCGNESKYSENLFITKDPSFEAGKMHQGKIIVVINPEEYKAMTE